MTRSVQLDMRGTTARSASAVWLSQSFTVDHTKRTEALFIAHSSTAQKATFIRVNNRSLKKDAMTARVYQLSENLRKMKMIVGGLTASLSSE